MRSSMAGRFPGDEDDCAEEMLRSAEEIVVVREEMLDLS